MEEVLGFDTVPGEGLDKSPGVDVDIFMSVGLLAKCMFSNTFSRSEVVLVSEHSFSIEILFTFLF